MIGIFLRTTKPNREIAVDFGTSNSQIAYKDKAGVIRSIEVDGDAKIPTSVYYSPADKQFFFGQKAEQAYADACADAAQVMQPSFERLQRYVRELPVQPGCILMVGGSSRMLYIQERLKSLFPTIPVYTPNGGDKAVAEGTLHVSASYERLTGFELVTEAMEDKLVQATHGDIVLSL